MNGILVFGAVDDVRGFRLAGAAARVVHSGAELERALAETLALPVPPEIVLVDEALAREAAQVVTAAQARPGPPVVVVLPRVAEGQGGDRG